MGKRILVQRRGRGYSQFRAMKHNKRGKAGYLPFFEDEEDDKLSFMVLDLLHEPGRGTPLAVIQYENGEETLIPALEGMYVGQICEQGSTASPNVGNVLPIGKIPEGNLVCNIEMQQNDGGALCRASGAYAQISTQTEKGTIIKLPSKQLKTVPHKARATIGIVASGGRRDRPFLKAGLKRSFFKAKGHKAFPRVRGVAMVIASHPFGGGSHQGPGRPTTVSRNAPPGRKVGLIAARRTGIRRGRIR
jgi:large subunit ribosomal protein L2